MTQISASRTSSRTYLRHPKVAEIRCPEPPAPFWKSLILLVPHLLSRTPAPFWKSLILLVPHLPHRFPPYPPTLGPMKGLLGFLVDKN